MNSILNKSFTSDHSILKNYARSRNTVVKYSLIKFNGLVSALTNIILFGLIFLFITSQILPCQTCSNFKTSTKIQLDKNGYKNILIAIAEDVAEDYQLIERIKSTFTEASELLFNVTK